MALLQSDCWPAMFRDDASSGTTVETHSTLSRSDPLATCFLELERLNQELKSKLRDDFLSILNGMANISLSSTPQPPSPSPTPPSRSLSLAHGTSFVTEAYSWLLENIATPYPSTTVKASLAQRYNCSLSAVNTWFVNARRRMGWTALCRDHFNNCRADALDAAYRALVKEDPKRPLPVGVVHAFVSVKVAVEELYASTLSKSALASDFDGVVENAFGRAGVSVNQRECSKPEGEAELSKPSDVDPMNCNQSPDYSPSSSSATTPLESLIDEHEGEEHIVPPALAGRKRRFSSEETHATTSDSAARVVKRPRLIASIPLSTDSYLSSPATSVEETFENDHMQQSHPTSGLCGQFLPDASLIGSSPTPSQDLVAEPHLHAASDSLPLSTFESEQSIDEWFKTNFEALFTFPPPAEVAEPDYSTQWEVELFNNYIIPEDSQKTSSSPTQATPLPTDFIAFEDMLQTLQSGGSVALPETTHPPTVASIPDPSLEGLPLFPGLSEPIDWATILNADLCELTCGSMLPQPDISSALPEIDLSFLQLPQAWATVTS